MEEQEVQSTPDDVSAMVRLKALGWGASRTRAYPSLAAGWSERPPAHESSEQLFRVGLSVSRAWARAPLRDHRPPRRRSGVGRRYTQWLSGANSASHIASCCKVSRGGRVAGDIGWRSDKR